MSASSSAYIGWPPPRRRRGRGGRRRRPPAAPRSGRSARLPGSLSTLNAFAASLNLLSARSLSCGFLSGCHRSASMRYAYLMSATDASRLTPRTLEWSGIIARLPSAVRVYALAAVARSSGLPAGTRGRCLLDALAGEAARTASLAHVTPRSSALFEKCSRRRAAQSPSARRTRRRMRPSSRTRSRRTSARSSRAGRRRAAVRATPERRMATLRGRRPPSALAQNCGVAVDAEDRRVAVEGGAEICGSRRRARSGAHTAARRQHREENRGASRRTFAR